jgi:uncharacterized membrane protein YjgN (DUF898 family)
VPIVLTYFLPTFPLVLFAQMVRGSSKALELVAIFAYLVSTFVASGALTITLSDICLGTVPSVRRSFSRVLRDRTWLKLLTSGLLVGVLVLLGFLLLVLPGIWVGIRSIFSATIVVLEGRSGRDAIRRSFDLTRGQFWRILGLLALIALLGVISVGIVSAIAAAIVGMDKSEMNHVLEALSNLLSLGLVTPAFGIAMVLLYYDQRVRRESYDAHALSEDLMR